MTRLPDPGFPLWSPGSLKARAGDHKEILAELRREAARRAEFYPGRIAEGRMTEMEASAEISLIAAIADEFAWSIGDAAARGVRPAATLTWERKLACLRAEILIRRDSFPRLVREGRMTQPFAEEHLSLLEAAHAWYWTSAMDFGLEFAGAGAPRAIGERIREELCRRDAWTRNGGSGLGRDDVEILIDDRPVRHRGPGPFRQYHAPIWSIVNADGDDGLFGVDDRLEPRLGALDPAERGRTLFAIAQALTTAWQRRQAEPQQEAA